MFKSILFIAIIPALVIIGVIALTAKSQDTSNESTKEAIVLANSTYEVNKSSYSFGTISMKDGNVETEYELTNTGNEEIFVNELFTSCMCTKAQLTFADGYQTGLYGMKGHGGLTDFYVGKSIKPGETAKVKAVFDPNAHGPQGVGPIKRNITLATNLQSTQNIQFTFDAEVTR